MSIESKIEGTVIIPKDRQVTFLEGKFSFRQELFDDGAPLRIARFNIDWQNPEVFIEVGKEQFHVWGSGAFKVAHLTLASPSLSITKYVIQGPSENDDLFLSSSDFSPILERKIPQGERLDVEWLGVQLTIRNQVLDSLVDQ